MAEKPPGKRGRKKLGGTVALSFERLPSGVSHHIDLEVGKQLRKHRTLCGITQKDLGDKVGLTFQQIQKYERGDNRIGASRLFEFSCIFDVPISSFFDGVKPATPPARSQKAGLSDVAQDSFDPEVMMDDDTSKLVRAYCQITDPDVRKKINALLASLAKSQYNAK